MKSPSYRRTGTSRDPIQWQRIIDESKQQRTRWFYESHQRQGTDLIPSVPIRTEEGKEGREEGNKGGKKEGRKVNQ